MSTSGEYVGTKNEQRSELEEKSKGHSGCRASTGRKRVTFLNSSALIALPASSVQWAVGSVQHPVGGEIQGPQHHGPRLRLHRGLRTLERHLHDKSVPYHT